MNFLKKIMGEDDVYEKEEHENRENFGFAADEDDDGLGSTKPRPQFVLVKPDKREDLMPIADNLLNRKTVVLNLELVKSDTRRFIDFLSGVAYALNGQVKKVASNTYLIIPGGLEVSGDIFDDMENEF